MKTYNVQVVKQGSRWEAKCIDLDLSIRTDSENEAIRLIQSAIEENAGKSRFAWCIKCRRYEARGAENHLIKKRGRKKKVIGVGSVEDELVMEFGEEE